MQDHDHDLSPDARSYIQSLTMSTKREAAREYARMDQNAFQARVGPALDEVDNKIEHILVELRRPRLSRGFTGALAITAAAVTDVALNFIGSLVHHVGK